MRVISFVSGNRTVLIAVTVAVCLLTVLAWSFAPLSRSIGGNAEVSAAIQEGEGGATAEMLAYALDLKSAASLAAFGGKSVSDRGSTQFRGLVGSTGEMAGVGAENFSAQDFSQTKRDLTDTFAAADQLPCTHVSDTNLGGQTFGPGVYCLSSARLAGRMTVDAGGDANARFVLRVNGAFNAENASSIASAGEAVAANVYIFARGTATIGEDSTIGANIISRDSVRVGHGSTVSGKVIGVNGSVMTDANIIAAGTGYIEICKQLFRSDSGSDPIPAGTIFSFTISGVAGSIQVPAGGCSPPILVASGNVTVTEQIRLNTAVIAIAANPANRLVSFSLGLQQAVVAVPDGDVTNQTVVTFTNQTTRTGTVEICKFGLDIDVYGFFGFTVQGAPGQTFSIPVGFCSGPISVTIPQVGNGPFTARVTELAQPTFRLEDVTTFPKTALPAPFTPNAGFDGSGVALADNTNGGFAIISLNSAGGASNQTTVRFFNRSLPGRIKVCKIAADPVNIPVGILFRFELNGLAPTSSTQTLPGVGVTVTVDVPAGPAGQGGFCTFAPGTWVVGEPVLIRETGLAPGQVLPTP